MREQKTAHCPHCAKPVLSEGQFHSFAEFTIKCPWCQNFVQINITAKITATSPDGNMSVPMANANMDPLSIPFEA